MVSCISTPTLRNLQHLATFSGSEIQQTIPTVSNALLGLSETVLSYQTATVTTADRARELVALQQQLNLLPFILQQQQQMSLQQPEHQLQLHRALLQRQLMIASHPSIQNDTNSQMLRQQEQHQQQQRDYRLLQNLALDGTALQQQQPAETLQQSEIEQLLKKYRQQNQDDYQ